MLSDAANTLLEHAPVAAKQKWLHETRWANSKHKFQWAPKGDWDGWMLQAGRGAGKTRTGAEDAVAYCLDNPNIRYAIVAPTISDARDICIEGESGVLFVLSDMGLMQDDDYTYNRSLSQIIFNNGSRIDTYSAEKASGLRGPNHHRAWCDELASWKDAHKGNRLNTTYNNLMLGLRLGEHPRHIITTTPRRAQLIRELHTNPKVIITRGSTHDNLDNLSPVFADQILQYEGSMIGRQEIEGELLDEVEGALWTREMIEAAHIDDYPDLARVVVGVDPPGGATEAGIVTAGITKDACVCDRPREQLPHLFILADDSLKPSGPGHWGAVAVNAFDEWDGDRIAAEINFGGDMVEHVIRGVRNTISYKTVRASRGKIIRAEPVAALYEQGRVHHLGAFPKLEDEMTTYTVDENWSPNRLDAMVWAVTDLSPWKGRKRRAGMDLTTGLGSG
jgi:phage terminase large subunit-like protein